MKLEDKAVKLRDVVLRGASSNDVLQMLLDVQKLERERLANASPDELMQLNARMAICVGVLVGGCLKNGTGRQAVAVWDTCRGVGSLDNQ